MANPFPSCTQQAFGAGGFAPGQANRWQSCGKIVRRVYFNITVQVLYFSLPGSCALLFHRSLGYSTAEERCSPRHTLRVGTSRNKSEISVTVENASLLVGNKRYCTSRQDTSRNGSTKYFVAWYWMSVRDQVNCICSPFLRLLFDAPFQIRVKRITTGMSKFHLWSGVDSTMPAEVMSV